MRKTILPFLILLFSYSLSAQQINIIKRADSLPSVKEKGLVFIHPDTDLQNYLFVGSVEISAEDFSKIIIGLQSIAVDLFANSFKYTGRKNVDGKMTMSFDLFSVTPEHLEANTQSRETNILYFLGNDKKTQKFKIDDRKVELSANETFRFEIPKNKQIKVSKGGLTGMTLIHRWREDQPVIFYALGSGNISLAGDGYSSLELAVNTGSIIELKSDFAYLLMELKK